MTGTGCTLLALLALAPFAGAQGKNVLFYGNSYTYYVWGYGVPEVVGLLAIEAGHPAPTIKSSLTGGGTLPYYATDPGQIAAISNLVPAGQTWDAVVMQGHALGATNGVGFNVNDFLTGAEGIMSNVRNHSPAARGVMYQTWASAWGQMYYPVPWPTPMAMHDEIRGNYRLAVSNLNALFGPGAAVNAAAGDAVALLEWDPIWYEADLFHPNPSMILLAAMCIYTAIYEEPVCGIEPVFDPPGPLATSLLQQGVGEAEWRLLSGLADRSAVPAHRSYPGSGDHLLLESSVDMPAPNACPEKRVTFGSQVQVRMRSLNDVFDAAPAWLLLDVFPTGSPPGASVVYPELQSPLGSAAILIG
ncbi:MAG: hypothetical protein KAI24_24930, partial [Planctomycetes bacterium]|nr:hypothetical protein [Planctomycetota bacterium]